MECTRCGAPVEASAVDCAYCGAPTANAERVRAEEQARKERVASEQAEGARREQTALRDQLERVATRTLVLSLIGFFVCFIPILQIISMVSYMRARSMARRLSVAVPAQATTGFVFSSLSLTLAVVGIVWAIVSDNNDQERADMRIAVLDGQARVGSLQPSLDWATACALAEIHALKDGYAGEKGRNLVHFDCVGKIAQAPGRPMLEHFSFRSGSNDKRFDVTVCFDRGAKWYVAEMNESRTCRQPATEPAAAAPAPPRAP